MPELERSKTDETAIFTCDVPEVSASAGAPPAADADPATASAVAPVSVVAPGALDDLSRQLPDWTDSCSSCVLDGCSAELATCASDAACSAFVRCRWGRDGDVSPAGEQRCAAENQQSPELDGSPIRNLSNCWANKCTEACQLGTEWGCLENYELPVPDSRGVVAVAQTLQRGFTNAPFPAVAVRFCPLLTDVERCESEFDARGCTDPSGVARLELPVQTDDRLGWLGYRRATQPDNLDVLLQSNVPVVADRFMLQHVPTSEDLQLLAGLSDTDIELGNVIFQVFDCAHNGAEGVAIELSDAPDPLTEPDFRIGYQEDERNPILVAGGTHAAAAGGGGIQSSRANGLVSLRAVRMATGQVVARPNAWILPGRVTLLEIHPDPLP